MATLTKEQIAEFLTISYGSGWGSGNSSGSGDGSGSGSGWGYGSGSGSGNSSGSGSGWGWGWGWGSGNSSGDGSGNSSGSGYGSGSGEGVTCINGNNVYIVDGLPTIFRAIRGSTARGALLCADLTLAPCYVAKFKTYFAHGEILKEAVEAVREKYFDDMPVEEKIDTFLKEIELDREYPASEFYKWHHRLTGSCEMGRKEFMRSHDIKMDDMFTVAEFIEIVKGAFGGEIIERLRAAVAERTKQTTTTHKGC